MPRTAAEIVRILDPALVVNDCFIGTHPEESQLAKVYGGQLIGQALASAARTVDSARPAHSVQSVCLVAGNHDEPVRYEVDRVRDGRSFSSRAVRAIQGDRQILRMMASFQPTETGLTHQLSMPVTAPPQEVPSLYDVMHRSSALSADEWRQEWAALDIRYVEENLGQTPGRGPGVQQIWMRVKEALPDDPTVHQHAIAYLSDLTLLATSLLPHGVVLGAPDLPRATLNHSVWFHTAARADEWLFVDQRSPWAGGARGLSFASVYTEGGRLVASLAQEGLIRPLGALRQRLGME